MMLWWCNFLSSVSCMQFSEKWTLKPFNFIAGNKSIAISHKKVFVKTLPISFEFLTFFEVTSMSYSASQNQMNQTLYIIASENTCTCIRSHVYMGLS